MQLDVLGRAYTKGALRSALSGILYAVRIDRVLGGDELAFVRDAFAQHYKGGDARLATANVGVRWAGYPGFVFVLPDGSVVEPSIRYMGSTSHIDRVTKRLRKIVDDDTRAHRREHQTCSCGAPGQHTDHVSPTFAELRDAWLARADVEQIEAAFDRTTMRHVLRWRPTGVDLVPLWLAYHREHAKLQTLCVACHKAKTTAHA